MGLDAMVACSCKRQGRARPSRRACKHPDGHYAAEHISNWTFYRDFVQFLVLMGDRYPTLLDELPTFNEGTTSATAAAAALEELSSIRALPALGRATFLVDVKTGAEMNRYV